MKKNNELESHELFCLNSHLLYIFLAKHVPSNTLSRCIIHAFQIDL